MSLDTRPTPTTTGDVDHRTADAGWSLGLGVAALVLAPLLLALPLVCFLPPLLAAVGAVTGWAALRRGDRPGLATTGLVVSVVVCGLTLGLASLWTAFVVNPAISGYPELQEAIRGIWER
ncbi:hypothetical protein [Desertihabitans aurantiacus]|uniref:hypothetical protein n=1 Tax=Desertihabitans aurantiacus TaxID=2282477 RepID=UPI000DF82706|nr:hypothetical protein [Desertihabitans aurantiacus]